MVILKVNRKKVSLNLFVKKVLINVLVGIISALHGVEDIKTIDLKIKF